jgi:hypothetical protein
MTHWSQVDLGAVVGAVVGAVALTVDGINESVWIAGADALWKLSIELEGQTRLDGFTSILEIAVAPGPQ